MIWTIVLHIWKWLVRFFGSAAMIFAVISALLVLGESAMYRLGRKRSSSEGKRGDEVK
jgi:hypothetical protein